MQSIIIIKMANVMNIVPAILQILIACLKDKNVKIKKVDKMPSNH